MAEAMTEMASSWPMTFLCSSSSILQELLRLALHDARERDAGHVGDDLLDVLHVDHVLFHRDRALPALLDLVHLALELPDHVAHGRGLLVVLGVHEAGLLQVEPLDLLFQVGELPRPDGVLDPPARAGLVDEVDGLVGQVALRDVAPREGRGRLHRGRRVHHAVVLLVVLLDALEDLHRLLHRGLAHVDGLEPALQRRVLLDVLLVLVERRGADALQLAAGERGLQHVGGVDGPLGAAGADDRVQLVDEEHDVARGEDLLHHALQALLELAAVLRAGHEGGEVQRQHALADEDLGHGAVHDLLGQALDDGRLADARLADEHGVVLRPAREDLDDPLDLLLPADHRVQLVVPGKRR